MRSPSFAVAVVLLVSAALTSSAQDVPRDSVLVGETVGRVVDAATREPLDGAVISFAGAEHRTDERGGFRISGTGVLEVRRLGYLPRRVRATGQPLVIEMTAVARALESVVVTASRREQKLKDAIVSTELISRREIQQSGASDVAAVVAGQTGIQLEGGLPAGAGVLLQGLGAQRVLILMDGQPIAGRIAGHLDLSRFPADMIERIEVVKGPQSTLYGSEAMGGVVNLITRRPRRRGVEAELAVIAGSRGRRDATATTLARNGSLDLAVDGGRREIDLVPGRGDAAATFANRWDVAPRAIWRIDSATTVEGGVLHIDERQRYRIGQLYQHADNVQSGARIGASRRFEARDTRLSVTLHRSRFEHLSRRSTTPEPVAGTGDLDVQSLLEADMAGSARLAGGVVDGGIELRRERVEADRVEGGSRSLSTAEPFAQVTWARRGVSLVPGARVSWSEQWGSALSPRLAAMWRPAGAPALAFRSSVSGGYRAPDFKELYLEFVNASAGYAVRGNPDLTPERSVNVSGGVEWTTARLASRASAYHNRYTDFIETIETATPGEYTYRNIARGTTTGIDLDATVSGAWWRVDAGYAWLRARSDDGGALLGRAPHAARLAATMTTGRGPRLSIVTIANGAAPIARDSTSGAVRWRGRYVRIDARLAQRISSRLELAAAAENVFDERMGNDWPGYTGRLLTATARFSGSTR